MKNWCRIIKLPEHDVLVQRLSDEENKEHLSVSIKLQGVLATLNFGFDEDEKKCDDAFKSYKREMAMKAVETITEMFN